MQSAAVRANATWNKFSAFRVLGDHEPMPGFRLVMQLAATPESIARMLAARAKRADLLDSELARATVRAGVGLLQSHFVSFAYATPEEIVALIRLDAVQRVGSSLAVYDRLVSMYASRVSVLLGEEVVVSGSIYEFPDLGIAQRAFIAAQEWVEEATPMRSAWRACLRLRSQAPTPCSPRLPRKVCCSWRAGEYWVIWPRASLCPSL